MIHIRACLAALLMLVPVIAGCQHRPGGDGNSGEDIALRRRETDGPLILHVRSDAFDQGEDIPHRYTAYGQNISPILGWSGAPAATKSQVLMVEDPDAPDPKPYIHWLVYNIAADVTRLPLNVPPSPELTDPRGAMQGRNSKGNIGYFGPRPPKDDPAHHYHFQLFALNAPLHLPPGASREELLRAMNGHVVAKGDLVGTYRER